MNKIEFSHIRNHKDDLHLRNILLQAGGRPVTLEMIGVYVRNLAAAKTHQASTICTIVSNLKAAVVASEQRRYDKDLQFERDIDKYFSRLKPRVGGGTVRRGRLTLQKALALCTYRNEKTALLSQFLLQSGVRIG